MRSHVVHLPALPALAWRGLRHVMESAVIPAALFYLLLTVAGFGSGVLAALGWSFAALAYRVVSRKPLPAILLITTVLLIARTILGLCTGSVFFYFLQPTLQNFLLAVALLGSAPLNQPLLARLANDFCALPPTLCRHPRVRVFFQRVSLLWAFVFAVNGIGTLFMLVRATVGDFLMVSTIGSYTLVGIAVGLSLWWFRRSLRGAGIVLRLGPVAGR